jgi:cyclophilin family peptidyl-prolyl cis-trans isomerase
MEAQRRRRRRLRNAALGALVVLAALGIIYVISRPSPKKAAAACTPPPVTGQRVTTFFKPPAMTISTSCDYKAVVQTDVGTFTISLYAKTAPVTVNDFVFLARHHFYDTTEFHRVIKGFVVQGGAVVPPTPQNPDPAVGQGPGYTVRGEVPKPGHPTYPLWSVAMAKTADEAPGTSGSQFFIVVGKEGEDLPPVYSLFGRVTSGMSVVEKIADDGGPAPYGFPKKVHYIEKLTIVESAPPKPHHKAKH